MDKRQLQSTEDRPLYESVTTSGRNFKLALIVLGALTLWGLAAYIFQYNIGLGVTGLSRQIFWGIYITNFVFFIGISHAGTLISAILRLVKAEWRRPITRAAEMITVLVLFFGVGSILIDLGRPDRMLYLARYANFRSPLLWDVTAVAVYLTSSSLFLYLALIPDIALLRDRGGRLKWLYQMLALGWEGTERQQARLDKAIRFFSILVILVAVSVHTVVSFVFAMTIQPMWHSAIFGPYFVAGAIFSGIAALIISMYLIRKFYHLEDYLKPVHFNNLGLLLLVMALFWFYFTFAEYLTAFYGNEPLEMSIFWSKFTGQYAFFFWSMVMFCFVIPVPLLAFKQTRTITGITIASISVVIGMWLERFVIVVPTLTLQRLPAEQAFYHPTWVEFGILVGCLALFCLLYVLFTKVFPIISIWELKEGKEHKKAEVREWLRNRPPEERAELQREL